MSTSTLEPQTESPAIAVPNFKEDERNLVRYDAMIDRRKKTFATEHVASIRRNFSTKRDDLRAELDEAQAELERAQETLDKAREAYRAAYPKHVKRTRIIEPTGMENLKSFGAANKLYRAAHDAWLAADHAASVIRRIEHNEAILDAELAKALEHAPEIIADVIASEKWLAEIHQEEELANVKAKVDEIEAERASYAERLEAGRVTPAEVRLRAFARADIKHAALSMSSVIFLRIDRFGDDAFLIMRDLRKQLYGLPYDRRLEPLFGGVWDVVKVGDNAEVRPSLGEGGRPIALAEHFTKCAENPEAAAAEIVNHRRFTGERRTLASMPDPDAIESTVIEAFAILAAEHAD